MPNPKEIFATITDSVGVLPAEADETGTGLSVSSYEQKEIAKAEDFEGKGELNDQQLEDDYAFARRNVQDVIESGQAALQAAVEVSNATGNPEIFASVSSLIHSLIAANRALLDIQNQVKKTKIASQKLLNGESDKNEKGDVTNNFFIGSTDEMLQALEAAQEKKNLAIDVEFTKVD